MSYPKSFTNWLFLLIGLAMIIFAFAFSNAGLSQLFLGGISKDLSWGPALFRVLFILHGVLLVALGLFLKTSKYKTSTVKTNEPLITPKTLIFLIILTVIAFVLRSINLNSDLWVDEVYTLVDFVRLPMGQILTSFSSQNQHMFYSFLARISFDIFGESAWALRLPSVLFGIGSIWAMYFLCKKILGSREAILAAVLMTVSYHHIWFSQNARGYMGLLLFTLLATWFWFEALEKNEWRWWLAYSAAVILGMWIHMTMAFVVAAHGITYLAFLIFPKFAGKENKTFSPERRAGIKPFIAWALSVTVTLQLYALALPEFLRTALHEESRNSEWTNPIWVITESLQSLSIGFAGIAVVLCGGGLVLFGWISLFNKNRRAAILTVLPGIFAGSFMLIAGHNLFPRFFFFAMGFGLLIVIYGAMELPKFVAKHIGLFKQSDFLPAYAGVAIVLMMIGVSILTIPKNYALPKQDFSGARNYVENLRQSDEKIVAVSIAGEMYGKYFAPKWTVANTNIELENIQQNNKKVWLIYTLSPEIKAFHPDMWRNIERDYETVQVFPGTLNGGEIYVCQKRNTVEEKNESNTKLSKSENIAVR